MIKKILFLAVIGLLVWLYAHFCGARTYPPGILVKTDPIQEEITEPMEAISKEDYLLKPLARYTITARVLHTKHYWAGGGSDLVPYDVAVGWGSMSDQSVIDKLEISQGNRFYFYEYQNPPPLPKDEMITHSANMHLIPSSFRIRNTIAWLRAGDVVKLRGLLVEATNPGMPDIKPWTSSLSRADSGNGACELMWVDSIEKY